MTKIPHTTTLNETYSKFIHMSQLTISFYVRQYPNVPDADISVVASSGTPFSAILQMALSRITGGITLDKIAIITPAGTLLMYQDAQQSIDQIVAQYSTHFFLTDRFLVNGPNLAQVEPLMPSLPNEIIAQMFNLNELMVIEDLTSSKAGQKQKAPIDFFGAEQEKVSTEDLKMKGEENSIEKPPAFDLGLKGRLGSPEKTETPTSGMATGGAAPSIPAPPSRGAPPSSPGGVTPKLPPSPQSPKMPSPPQSPPPMAAPAPAQEPTPSYAAPPTSASTERNQPLPPPPPRAMEQQSRRQDSRPPPSPKMDIRAKDKAVKEEKKEKPKPAMFALSKKKAAKSMPMDDRSFDQLDRKKEEMKEIRDEAEEEAAAPRRREREVDASELMEPEEMDEDVLRTPEEGEMSTMISEDKPTMPIISDEAGAASGEIAGLIPKKVPAPEELSFEKNIAVEYFDKMNPTKYYPLIVNIADIEQATIAPEENIITGERKIQKKEKHEFKLKTSIVVVRPVFPGCEVTPFELQTDFKNPEDELKFYVTPIVKDAVEGRIDFLNEGNIVHSYDTPAKCEDPRFAKTIATYGTIVSILPKILLIFNIDLGNSITLDQLLPFLGTMFGGVTLTNFIAIFGIIMFLIIGYVIHRKRQPKSTRTNFSLTDVRMKKLAF